MRKICVFILVLILLSCAAPAPKHVSQEFVEKEDIEVISSSREGLYLFSKSRFKEAEEKFREALELEPEDKNILYNLGLSLSAQEKYAEAERIFKDLIKRDEQSIKYKRVLANNFYLQKDLDSSISLLKKAHKIAEVDDTEKANSLLISREIVKIYFEKKMYKAALDYSESAFETSKAVKELEVYVRNLIALDEISKAKTVLVDFPLLSDPKVLLLKSLIALGSEDYKESFEAGKRAIDITNNKPVLNIAEVTLVCIAANVMGELEIEAKDFQEDKIKDLFNGEPLKSDLISFWPKNLKDWLRVRV